MPVLKDSHRLFIQSLMCRGVVETAEVERLYYLARRRCQESEDLAHFKSFVETADEAVGQFHMGIRKAVDEATGTDFYALINTVDSPFLRHFSYDFNDKERELFRALLEKIVKSDDGLVLEVDALNMVDGMDVCKMSKREAEAAISKLADHKWLLLEHEPGRLQLSITLHARSILELGRYLREEFPDDTKDCDLCKRLCIRGHSCPTCECKIHIFCARQYYEQRPATEQRRCPAPACGESWPDLRLSSDSAEDNRAHSNVSISRRSSAKGARRSSNIEFRLEPKENQNS